MSDNAYKKHCSHRNEIPNHNGLPVRPVTCTGTTSPGRSRRRGGTGRRIQRLPRVTYQTRSVCTARRSSYVVPVVTGGLTSVDARHLHDVGESLPPLLRLDLHPWLAGAERVLRLVHLHLVQVEFAAEEVEDHRECDRRRDHREDYDEDHAGALLLRGFTHGFVLV